MTLENQYFNYLCSLVQSDRNHYFLLRRMFDREFYWTVDMDANRAADGLALRSFFENHGYFKPDLGPCRVLEVLVGLAVRCEEDIMQDDAYGNRTGVWFWNMVNNLGLGDVNDRNYDSRRVDQALDRFLNRRYDRFGRGGLFYIRHPRRDLRRVELWYQMCWYLDEQYQTPLF